MRKAALLAGAAAGLALMHGAAVGAAPAPGLTQ